MSSLSFLVAVAEVVKKGEFEGWWWEKQGSTREETVVGRRQASSSIVVAEFFFPRILSRAFAVPASFEAATARRRDLYGSSCAAAATEARLRARGEENGQETRQCFRSQSPVVVVFLDRGLVLSLFSC